MIKSVWKFWYLENCVEISPSKSFESYLFKSGQMWVPSEGIVLITFLLKAGKLNWLNAKSFGKIWIINHLLSLLVMNKAQLIDAVAAEAGMTKADAKKAIEAFVKTTTEALKQGDRLALVGFGSFSVSDRPARTGRNPQTGATIKIAGKKVVKFKAGNELTDAVQ